MLRLGRTVLTVSAMVLSTGVGITTDAAAASAAAANTAGPVTPLACGAQVSSSVTLGNNIGPCVGMDGIDIVANGVHLNLNGHTITGSDTTNATNTEQVGVRLVNVQNAMVNGRGTITAFDAGVAIAGGGVNTITGIIVHDNISHVTFTGGVDPTNPEATACNFGDGITTDNSSNNIISRNTAVHNGPYGGISLVDASTSNHVYMNTIVDQTVGNTVPDFDHDGDATNPESGAAADADDSGPCGPFGAAATGQGREFQDIGIRMEGPGAANNIVNSNLVNGSQLDGISVFDNICPGNPFHVTPTAPNANNLIENNTTTGNGFVPGASRDGIAVVQQGPGGVVCVPSNTTITHNVSSGNARDGIFMAGRGSHSNTITDNRVVGNGTYGIGISGPSTGTTGPLPGSGNNTIKNNVGFGNFTFDAFDGNLSCGTNSWSADHFNTVNMACIH